MLQILSDLQKRGLVVALTPPGRGQLFTHTLYRPEELERLKQEAGRQATILAAEPAATTVAAPQSQAKPNELAILHEEVAELRRQVEQLTDRLDRLES